MKYPEDKAITMEPLKGAQTNSMTRYMSSTGTTVKEVVGPPALHLPEINQ
jgi:hypothetical protein